MIWIYCTVISLNLLCFYLFVLPIVYSFVYLVCLCFCCTIIQCASVWCVCAYACFCNITVNNSDTVSFACLENGIIKSDKVYEVMLATDRAHFSRCNPYMDSPQSIGTSARVVKSRLKSKHSLTSNQICASLLTKRLSSNNQRPTHGMTLKRFLHLQLAPIQSTQEKQLEMCKCIFLTSLKTKPHLIFCAL